MLTKINIFKYLFYITHPNKIKYFLLPSQKYSNPHFKIIRNIFWSNSIFFLFIFRSFFPNLIFFPSMISGTLNSGEIELNTTGFIYSEPSTANAAKIGEDGAGGDLTILYGIVVVLTGAFCFGTMHVPIRRYAQENDGIFVQWVMSFGSLMIGFTVNMIMGSPPVQLLATGGGIFWCFANSIAQFVISGLGLAPALLLWSTTNILTGWSAGRFGLFGLKKKTPEHALLNVFGLITIISGGICFAFIKKSLLPVSNKQAHVYPRMRSMRSTTELFDAEEGASRNGGADDGGKMDNDSSDDVFENASDKQQNSVQKRDNTKQNIPQPNGSSTIVGRKTSLEHPSFLLSVPQIMVIEETAQEKERRKQQQSRFQFGCAEASTTSSGSEPIEKQSRCKRFRKWMMRNSHRLLCIFLSLVSGFFYAATVLPVLYIQDNLDKFPGAPKSGLNYIFSHYFGIFLGATGIFITYALFKKNKPTVNAQVILPSLASGAIWGCGMVSLFLANDLLTQTVTYPVLITIPGCVAAIWSIFYFKEIQMNRRNTTIVAIAFTLIFTGAFMVFVSKSKVHFDGLLLRFS